MFVCYDWLLFLDDELGVVFWVGYGKIVFGLWFECFVIVVCVVDFSEEEGFVLQFVVYDEFFESVECFVL